MQVQIEIYNHKGQILLNEPCSTITEGHALFERLEATKWPETYKGLTMNLFEGNRPDGSYPEGSIGKVMLVELINCERFERRELFRAKIKE